MFCCVRYVLIYFNISYSSNPGAVHLYANACCRSSILPNASLNGTFARMIGLYDLSLYALLEDDSTKAVPLKKT